MGSMGFCSNLNTTSSLGHHKPAPPILAVSNLKAMSAEYKEVTARPVCALVGLNNNPLPLCTGGGAHVTHTLTYQNLE